MKKKKHNIFWKIYHWYILGQYHCDKCKYCWGGQYLPGCDDYDDAGCYLRGQIRDTCRYVKNPISNCIVNKNMNKKFIDQIQIWNDVGALREKSIQIYDKLKQDKDKYDFGSLSYMSKLDQYQMKQVILSVLQKCYFIDKKSKYQKLKESFKDYIKQFVFWNFICYFKKPK